MKRTYECGQDSNVIKLSFQIGTVGVPFTKIFIVRSGGQRTEIKTSTKSRIPMFSIGQSENLKNSYLIIRTLVNLSSLTVDKRKDEIENMKTRYNFKGGKSGAQTFSHDMDDIFTGLDEEIIEITKPIELI